MDRYTALALVRSVRGWAGMVGARRLGHALDALVLASGLVGAGFLRGGMANQGEEGSSQKSERLWFSPHCIGAAAERQPSLPGCA